MEELSVEISPPEPSTPYHSLLPNAYFQSSPVARAIKRKFGLPITTPIRKKLKFDIIPKNGDIGMASYKKRIDVALGKPRLTRALLPMECISNMQKANKQHERQFTEIHGATKTIHGPTKTNQGTTTGERTWVENNAGKCPHGKLQFLLHSYKIRWDTILPDSQLMQRQLIEKVEVDPK